jgi:hypothetical protein
VTRSVRKLYKNTHKVLSKVFPKSFVGDVEADDTTFEVLAAFEALPSELTHQWKDETFHPELTRDAFVT